MVVIFGMGRQAWSWGASQEMGGAFSNYLFFLGYIVMFALTLAVCVRSTYNELSVVSWWSCGAVPNLPVQWMGHKLSERQEIGRVSETASRRSSPCGSA